MYRNLYYPIPPSWDQRPCPIALGNLIQILKKCPDVVIVISSAWRNWKNLKELQTMFKDWLKGDYYKRIKGVTPTLCPSRISEPRHERGAEIDEWIKKNGHPSKFVILDDYSDMEPYMDHLHKTNPLHGLQLGDVHIIVEYFTGKKYYDSLGI